MAFLKFPKFYGIFLLENQGAYESQRVDDEDPWSP